MDVEVALGIVKQTLSPQQLSYVEELVFTRTWQGQRYREMAIDTGYEEGYLKDIGSRLWQTLSRRLGYPVSKKRLRFILGNIANQAEIYPIQPMPTVQVIGKKPEIPGSPLPFQSPWYVERLPLESMAMAALQQSGSLLRIKGARGLGKTSLINQMLGQAQTEGMQTVLIDIRQADITALDNFDGFLRWFCWAISQKLDLNLNVDDHWFASAGSKLSCTTFVQEQVLSRLDTPVVLAIDTLHHLAEHAHIACNFLAMLRSWYEQTRMASDWSKLRLVLAYAAELDVPLQTHQSPFNVGLLLDLPSLTLAQAAALAQAYALETIEGAADAVAALWERVGGHPYLLQLAFYWLQSGHLSAVELLNLAATDGGIYREHLHSLWLLLQQSPPLLEAWNQVLVAEQPVAIAPALAHRLEAMGLIALEGGRAKPRCRLYQAYFAELLADE